MALNVGDITDLPFDVRVGGALVDPGALSVVVTVDKTGGATVTHVYPSSQVVRLALGRFSLRHPCADWGPHTARVVISGAGILAETGEEPLEFLVRP
jgi:hypothetical protein